MIYYIKDNNQFNNLMKSLFYNQQQIIDGIVDYKKQDRLWNNIECFFNLVLPNVFPTAIEHYNKQFEQIGIKYNEESISKLDHDSNEYKQFVLFCLDNIDQILSGYPFFQFPMIVILEFTSIDNTITSSKLYCSSLRVEYHPFNLDVYEQQEDNTFKTPSDIIWDNLYISKEYLLNHIIPKDIYNKRPLRHNLEEQREILTYDQVIKLIHSKSFIRCDRDKYDPKNILIITHDGLIDVEIK